MGYSVDLNRLNYNEFVERITKEIKSVDDKKLLEKVILEFGNKIGDDLVILSNEFWEDGICDWNMLRMIREVFSLSTAESNNLDRIYYTLKTEIINYKEIDDAYDDLGIERNYDYEEE